MKKTIKTIQESLRALNSDYLKSYNSLITEKPLAKRETINALLFNEQLNIKMGALDLLLPLRRALMKETAPHKEKTLEAIDLLIADYKLITNDKNALGVNDTFSGIEDNIKALSV